jgi:glucose/arabinose dehydrogenase
MKKLTGRQSFYIVVLGIIIGLTAVIIARYLPSGTQAANIDVGMKGIKLPPGFHLSLFARVPGARQMCMSPSGILYCGTRTNAAPHLPGQKEGGGEVFAVVDKNHDGTADEVVDVAEGLHFPNGVQFKDGALYVAEISRIRRYDNIEVNLHKPPNPVLVSDKFPNNEWHGWKYIRFGPDGWLYVPVGAPCNVCEQADPRFGSLMRIKQDGSSPEIYAKGIRNTVGFDWDPKTKELWFTDNGRDYMGDNAPPDELNYAPNAGMNFGFPYCHGKGIPDPEFGKKHKCSEFTPATVELGAHHAALGMKFYTGTQFPTEYQGDVFIAEHGSWNSSHKVGYQVSRVHFENGKPPTYTPFATGFLSDSGALWARPVDVLVAPDGALLVSDDFGGAVYRITYHKD